MAPNAGFSLTACDWHGFLVWNVLVEWEKKVHCAVDGPRRSHFLG